MVRLIMCDLVDGDDFSIMGKHRRSKHRRDYYLHRVHIATSKQDIVIKWGIDNLNVDEDGFSPKFDENILEEPFRGGWSTIIGSQDDGEWY
jgi:hypothetical protein